MCAQVANAAVVHRLGIALDEEKLPPVMTEYSRGKGYKTLRHTVTACETFREFVQGLVSFKEGDRVLFWSPDLVGQEGNKLTRPWLGPYVVKVMLSSIGYLLESEVGGRHARAHANRMRKISSTSKETGDPREGMFPDSLRLIGKICVERRGHDGNGQDVRWLKVKLGGRAAPC